MAVAAEQIATLRQVRAIQKLSSDAAGIMLAISEEACQAGFTISANWNHPIDDPNFHVVNHASHESELTSASRQCSGKAEFDCC